MMNESTPKSEPLETPEPAPPAEATRDGAGGADGAGPRRNGEQTPPAAAAAPSVAAEIAQLQKERDEYRDQVLRSRADFANYQRRAREQADADRAYAVGSLARDLLDPIDNLGRAIEALRAAGAAEVTAGLDMVRKQLLDVLAKHGVEPIAAQGQPFDPMLHDAVLQQPSADHPEGTVVDELIKGYKIRDRVLRPSKVAVSVKPAASEGPESEEAPHAPKPDSETPKS